MGHPFFVYSRIFCMLSLKNRLSLFLLSWSLVRPIGPVGEHLYGAPALASPCSLPYSALSGAGPASQETGGPQGSSPTKAHFKIRVAVATARLGSGGRAGLPLRPGARGQSDEAERILAKAIQLHQAGDIEGAIREYREFLALRPNRVKARSNLGAALAHVGRYEEAIEQYQRALAAEPGNASARLNLALAYYKSAQISEAVSELSALRAAQPENMNVALLLGDCHLRLGENKKVIELLSPLEAAHPEDRALAYLLGTALIRDNQVARGQVLVDRILRDGDSAEARLLLGTAELMAHDFPGALKNLARVVELKPQLPSVHSIYGRALMESGDRERAAQAFRQELAIDPNDFDSNLYLGALLKQDQNNEEALRYLRRALQVRPGDLAARYQIGTVYLALGRVDDAQREFEQVVKEAPQFVEAHVSLASVYYRLKRKQDGDRERAIVQKLNAELQARQPGAQDKLGPAYRGETQPAPKPRD